MVLSTRISYLNIYILGIIISLIIFSRINRATFFSQSILKLYLVLLTDTHMYVCILYTRIVRAESLHIAIRPLTTAKSSVGDEIDRASIAISTRKPPWTRMVVMLVWWGYPASQNPTPPAAASLWKFYIKKKQKRENNDAHSNRSNALTRTRRWYKKIFGRDFLYFFK